MKKLFLLIVLILALGVFFFRKDTATTRSEPNKEIITQSPLNTAQSPFEPKRLVIEKLGVDTFVEHVGLDSKKNMDVPKNADNVAWYNLGAQPGEKGNAVLAGHFDKVDGSPAVFYRLKNLKKGDILTIYGASQEKLTYKVTNIQTYAVNSFPLQEVFGDSSISRLNLITCGGVWNGKTYSERTVVYSELES